MLDLHLAQGYTEIYPPYMVRREMMVGAAQLPKFEENIYHDAEEDFWFIGTAEIPLTNLHRDEILPPDALPLNYVAYSACFRREKMSAGRDVRGIKRGHQFDKVEMYKLTEPETSYDELETTGPRRRGRLPGPGASPTAWWRCAPATWVSRRPRSTIWSCGRRAWKSGWRSARSPTAPISRPGGPTSATARNRAPSRASSTPSTARDWPCPGP